MSAMDTLLQCLEKVQRTGENRYKACCPAHDDRSPSLAIREMPDGRVLVHCFGGCSTEAVLSAVGLTFSDLMPEPLGQFKPERRPFYAGDILKTASFEVMLAYLCAADLANGKTLADTERARLLVAVSRLKHACEVANGY